MNYSDVLRIRPFRDLWLGQAVSQLGDAFYYVIFMFMVKKVTGRNEMVGFVGALETIPFLILGPYSGVLADRIDRKKIMLWSDIISGIALAMLAAVLLFQAKPPIALLLATPFVLSSVRCFFMPAKSAAIPALVPPDMLLRASAFSQSTQTIMPLIGLGFSASIMGPLYALSPKMFYFSAIGLNAFSFFLSAFYITKLPKIEPDRTDAHQTHPMADFVEGLKYIGKRRELVVMFCLITVFRLMVSPFFVVYLAANDKWFGGKPSTVSWFEFSFFLGMVVASAAMGKFKPQKPGWWFCLGLMVVGLTVGAMAFSPIFWMILLWNVLAGLAVPPADIPINAYIQLSVPDAFRGRVNSALSVIGSGAMPIGCALAGLIVDNLGISQTFILMGAGMTLASLGGLLDPTFRNIVMPNTDPAEPPQEPLPDGVPSLK